MNNLNLLIRIIHYQGTYDSLLNHGFTFAQITSLLSEALVKGLIEETVDGLTLTTKGVQFAEALSTVVGSGGEMCTIRPLDERRIDKMNVFDIYLPSVKNSFFD